MKYLLTVFILAGGSGLATAAHYARITNQFAHKDCTYYNVSVWDDRGTADDPSDDIVLGKGTINVCDHRLSTEASAVISGTYEIESGCTIYKVKILKVSGEKLGVGAVGDCE